MNEFLPKTAVSFMKSILKKIKNTKLAALAALVVFGQGLYVVLPGLLGVLIDRVFVQENLTIQWLILFPIIWLVSTIFSSLGRFYASSITQDVRKISKDYIFRHIIKLPNSIYIERDAGEVEHLMQELSLNTRYLFNESIPFFIRTIATILVSLIIVGYTSIELLYLFLGWMVLYIPISYLNAKKSMKHVSASLLSSAEVSAATVEVIENHELIPAFGTEEFEIKGFNQFLERERQAYNKTQNRIDRADFFQRILLISLPVCIALFLVFSDKLINMTAGLIACIFSFTLILTNQIGDFGRGLLASMEMGERMKVALKKLASPFESPMGEVKTDKEPDSWDIRFENVSFNYANNPTIQNLNLEIKENQKIGIIGYSGAGKTTLVKLLRGSYRPSIGRIFIGGTELNQISRKSLARSIAEVSQTIPLFHRSIRENIAYGFTDVADEQIWDVLRKAQMADCVKKLPNGLDTIIGVRGQKLSGGERARIGIARALIREAKIIIFDEATAAIDSESELFIQKGLEEVMRGRTLIAIAHRLSTLRKMDRIIVLDKGQVIAEGPHEELINHNALYKRLWNAQVVF